MIFSEINSPRFRRIPVYTLQKHTLEKITLELKSESFQKIYNVPWAPGARFGDRVHSGNFKEGGINCWTDSREGAGDQVSNILYSKLTIWLLKSSTNCAAVQWLSLIHI